MLQTPRKTFWPLQECCKGHEKLFGLCRNAASAPNNCLAFATPLQAFPNVSSTIQDYALAHEASIRELYKQLFGEELEHVTPSHDTLKIVPCKSHSPQGLQGGLSKLDCGSPTVG